MTDNHVKKKIGSRHTPGLIAGKIKELRDRLGISQTVLSEHLGTRPNTISDWEKGLYVPSAMALMAISRLDEKNEEWWYEQAGPQFLERLRTVREAQKRRHEREDAERERGKIGWDPQLLKDIIWAADHELKKRKKQLPPEKFAELVTLFYEHFYNTKKWDSDFAEPLLRIA